MDIAVAGVASFIVPGRNNICKEIKIAMASVAPTTVMAHRAEAILVGKKLTEENIAKAAEQAAMEASPISDIRGSADYRREMVKVLTARTLKTALENLNYI